MLEITNSSIWSDIASVMWIVAILDSSDVSSSKFGRFRIRKPNVGNPGVAAAARYAQKGLPGPATVLLSFFNERTIKYLPTRDGWAQRILYKDGGAKASVKP